MHPSAIEICKKLANLSEIKNADCVLEVGSRKIYDDDWSPRQLFGPSSDYVGIDIMDGPNVDRVVPEFGLWPDLGHFSVAISMNTLEHCARPWEVVANMSTHLAFGGACILIAPFIWHRHDYPSDFFRFTGSGLSSMMECAGLTVKISGERESSRQKWDAWALGVKQ